jgi:pyruvate kinase
MIARHLLESMCTNPRPTRAEMTDTANAVLDSADSLLLVSETSYGAFPVDSVTTACRICRNAEAAMNYSALQTFIRDFLPKPFRSVPLNLYCWLSICTAESESVLLAFYLYC